MTEEEAKQAEVEDGEEDFDEDDDVGAAIADLRKTYDDSTEMERDWKAFAGRLEQGGHQELARVVRRLAGDLQPLLREVIGGAGRGIEQLSMMLPEPEDGGGLISEREGRELHELLGANIQVMNEAIEAKLADEPRLRALIALNEEKRRWIVDNSEFEPAPPAVAVQVAS